MIPTVNQRGAMSASTEKNIAPADGVTTGFGPLALLPQLSSLAPPLALADLVRQRQNFKGPLEQEPI